MHKNENTQNLQSFLAIKILRFLVTQIDILQEKNVELYLHFLKTLNANAKKTIHYIFQKVKSYFFANIYHSPFDSH